jgi:hypothetical protein
VVEEPGPVYRASKVSRGAAWLVLACAAVVSVYAIMASTGATTGSVITSGLFGLLAWALLRLEVRATPEALVSCGGRKMRRFPWADVRGFEVERSGREIAVLLKGNARHRLPIVEVAMRRVPAGVVQSELERYWKAHRRTTP